MPKKLGVWFGLIVFLPPATPGLPQTTKSSSQGFTLNFQADPFRRPLGT